MENERKYPSAKVETEEYFALFRGASIRYSFFENDVIREAIKTCLDEGRLIGQYDMDGELIISRKEKDERST